MSWAHVQKITQAPVNPIGTNFTAKAWPGTTTAGNLVLVSVNTSTTITGVTDNASPPNTYALAVALTGTGTQRPEIWYGVQVNPATTITVTASNTAAVGGLCIDEYSGNLAIQGSVLDKTASSQNASGTSHPSGTTAATAQSNELVYTIYADPGSSVTITPPGGIYAGNERFNSGVSGTLENDTVDGVAVATGAQSATFTTSGATASACVIATFLPAVSAAVPYAYDLETGVDRLLMEDGLGVLITEPAYPLFHAYLLEDASGDLQLEDGSGVLLAEQLLFYAFQLESTTDRYLLEDGSGVLLSEEPESIVSGVSVVPGTATLALSVFAPTVLTPRVVIPSTATLTLTRYAPVALAPRVAVPGKVSLTLTTFAPTVTISASRIVTPGLATLTLTRYAPTVLVPRNVIPGVRTLSLTSFGPAALTPRLAIPGTASLVLSRFAPAVLTPRAAVPGVRALSLTAFAPAITGSAVATPGTAHLGLTTFSPVVIGPLVPGGGAGGPRYVVSRPIQRLAVQRRIEPRPVRRTPITRALRLKSFRPTLRLTAHRTVTPFPKTLRLVAQNPEVVTPANLWVKPQTGHFLYGVSEEFWSLNRAYLLAELDPDLAKLDPELVEEMHGRTIQS